MTEQLYLSAQKIAIGFAFTIGKNINAPEIVNDAYLLIAEKNIPITLDSFRPFIKDAVRNYNAKSCVSLTDHNYQPFLSSAETKRCPVCENSLPLNCFKIRNFNAAGQPVFDAYCHECYKAKQKEFYKKRKQNADWYAKHLIKSQACKVKRAKLIKSIPIADQEMKRRAREKAKRMRDNGYKYNWRKVNPNRCKEVEKGRRATEYHKNWMKEYRERNREKIKDQAKAYRVNKKYSLKQAA